MAAVFFKASEAALDNITQIYNFVHPLNVGLRYLICRINEEIVENSSVNNTELREIFDPNNKVHGVSYIDLSKSADSKNEEQLAWLLLNNLFAIHEGWAENLYEELFKPYYSKDFIKSLEFYSLMSKLSDLFVDEVIDKKIKNIPTDTRNLFIEALQSKVMSNAFFDVYKNNSGFDSSKLDNYMIVYRLFKEARNCFMHKNFITSQELVNAYHKFSHISTNAQLDVDEVPIFPAPVLGTSLHISLRGVIGFSDILRRIIIITDNYLIRTKASEKEFLNRKPNDWIMPTLSSIVEKSNDLIIRYTKKLGFLSPKCTIEYKEFLIKNRIVRR